MRAAGRDTELGDARKVARKVLAQGKRTRDIALPGEAVVGTREMGDAVVAALGTAA